jgi:WD40 repeat protein
MAVSALPDGRRALSASADKTLKLWDLETGNPLAAFTADSDLFAVAVAANDRFVAGSSPVVSNSPESQLRDGSKAHLADSRPNVPDD